MVDILWDRGSGPKRAVVVAAVAGLVLLAWANRFIQDDAFISFRYADNLVRGEGLVWNPGERIEGYSNFLWTMLIAGGMKLGFEPVLFSQVLGIALFALTLSCSFLLARLLLQSDGLALAAIILLGTNHTMSAYATGGLETQLQTALVVAALYRTALGIHRSELTRRGALGLGFLFAAAVLTRMDAALACGIMGLFLLVHLRGSVRSWRERAVLAMCAAGPLLIMAGAWLLWKLSYYGSIIPNAFYVKSPGVAVVARGLNYLFVFLTSYWLIVYVPVIVFAAGWIRRQGSSSLHVLCVLTVAWLAYIVFVGGDFMEFRFLVPILPAGFIILTWLTSGFVRRPAVRAVLALLVLAGSVHHSRTFEYTPDDGIEPTWHLDRHITDPDEQWGGIGRALGEAFGPGTTVTIATTAAGAIPFYSRLRTVDMLGINDPWIAQHGIPFLQMAGHGKITTLRHLLERDVNLVLSHPILLGGSAPVIVVGIPLGDISNLLPEERMLHIPVDDRHTLAALYLHRHPVIDSVAAARGWTITAE